MKFYEIDAAIAACIDAETGEVDIEALEALESEKRRKIENLALYTIELAADDEALTAEIKRLTNKRDAARNKKNNLRKFLATYLAGEKFKTPLVSVSFRTTESVVVDDIDKLPAEFIVTKREVDKTGLKKAFETWDGIQGAYIERKQSVTIR